MPALLYALKVANMMTGPKDSMEHHIQRAYTDSMEHHIQRAFGYVMLKFGLHKGYTLLYYTRGGSCRLILKIRSQWSEI